MISFLISLAVLIGGYFLYGTLVERVFGVEPSRPTPAMSMNDGVDYVPMSPFRVFLIQFLNIAGLGPIFGAIMGIMFGPAAFLWIVLGTIFAGAVHDFVSAMMSLRSGGRSLPEIVGDELGLTVKQVMRIFSVVLLLLVTTVFVLTPAGLLAEMTPHVLDKTMWTNEILDKIAWLADTLGRPDLYTEIVDKMDWIFTLIDKMDWIGSFLDKTVWIGIIFGYYLLATLLPIDKLIGNLYPLFGAALLFMAVGLLCYLLFGGVTIPDGFSEGLYSRFTDDAHPVFPMMFVSIACGAISGFHATQSPMMARCLTNERLARPIFYGAMVAEGLVALIWAASTIAFMGSYEKLAEFMAENGNNAGALVKAISYGWLGTAGGLLALLGVVAAPITTGDTALRSARLITADMMKFDQKKLWRRLLMTLPLFALSFGLMFIDFAVLWRYFAWSNQTLAVFTLWAATVYLARHGKAYIITLLPAMFMSAVSVSYILFAPSPEGIGLNWFVAIGIGAGVAVGLLLVFAWWRNKYVRSEKLK